MAEAAHSLKGAAGILCAESIHDLAAEIEKQSREENLEALEALLTELSTEMNQCLEAIPRLRELLSHEAAGGSARPGAE